MSDSVDRYSRQSVLPEVGADGQRRISEAALEVRGSDGAIIECEYLYRAGVERLLISPGAEATPFEHHEWFRFFASRRIGAGAWRALKQLRQVLGLER
ncbi:MAG TPA: hypothetical protein VGJ84_02670 [Polyangiaceae bacterium]|jgi:hypothetical protein